MKKFVLLSMLLMAFATVGCRKVIIDQPDPNEPVMSSRNRVFVVENMAWMEEDETDIDLNEDGVALPLFEEVMSLRNNANQTDPIDIFQLFHKTLIDITFNEDGSFDKGTFIAYFPMQAVELQPDDSIILQQGGGLHNRLTTGVIRQEGCEYVFVDDPYIVNNHLVDAQEFELISGKLDDEELSFLCKYYFYDCMEKTFVAKKVIISYGLDKDEVHYFKSL